MFHEIINFEPFLQKSPFSGSDLKKILTSNKIGISLILSFKKAKQWPYYKISFHNENLEKVPVLWAFLYADSDDNVNLFLGIHPMKCFPSLYLKNNENFQDYPIPVKKIEDLTWAGCSRYNVNIAGKNYGVKQHEYCSSFGLPDDCHSKKFHDEYIDFIKKFKDYDIWYFEKDDIFLDYPKELTIHYMKDEFLPKQYFFYVDSASKFLSGIFHAKDLSVLNENWWYTSGKDFIKERNYYKSGTDFRYEEYTLDIIKRKTIFELIRLLLLLQNKDQFENFLISSMPEYDEKVKIIAEEELCQIVEDIKTEFQIKLDSLMKSLDVGLDHRKLRASKFIVMDMEFVRVNTPIKRHQRKKYQIKKRKLPEVRSHDFPSIFVSIIWNGKEKHAEIDIKILTLPCHFCMEKCRDIKHHSIKYECLHFAESFITTQISFFEEYLAVHESAKVFSYGRSDAKQLEYSDNFFNDSFETRLYQRKNRKRPLRISDIVQDIAIPETSLNDVEEYILKTWLIGWSREKKHSNVNRCFTTIRDNKNFSQRYHDAIETCVLDSLSTFLYLLYKDYRKNQDPIRFENRAQATLFDSY